MGNRNNGISLLIPTYNCADTIHKTLEAVGWADEILIVDSFSTDDTLKLCQEFGARVLQHEYLTPAKQKNWAIPYCRYPWVLQLDSDESLETGAETHIRSAVAQAAQHIHAFRLPRKNHVLGKWVRHTGIYPDYQIRLFRRDFGRFQEREVHEHLQVKGSVVTLDLHILHYGMPNISKQLRNLDRYTRHEADEARKQGKIFRWHDLVLSPWIVFFYRYFWLQGFRAGWRGFILCVYLAVYHFFAKAKLWELHELTRDKSPE